jgi:hypothetical protein
MADDELKKYLDHAGKNVLPHIRNSAFSIAVMDERVDAKMCFEVGAMVLLDKPVIVVAVPGAKISTNLKRVASVIIQGDISDPRVQDELQTALRRVQEDRRVKDLR